jgi:2-haloacid dehalogenase
MNTSPYKALFFDTGGTVLDWHGSLVDELTQVAAWQGAGIDRHAFVNEWRRRTMKGIVGQVQPGFNMDDVHLTALDDSCRQFGLPVLGVAERQHLWRGWHRLRAWPDFAPAQAALRTQWPVVSFTMLPTALVVAVSRRNGFQWDAIVSCEMIGTYKPHLETYRTAARWLNLEPAEVLMVACHNFDLDAARQAGMATAFVRRPDEWGPAGPPDPTPNPACTWVADGFDELRQMLGHAS